MNRADVCVDLEVTARAGGERDTQGQRLAVTVSEPGEQDSPMPGIIEGQPPASGQLGGGLIQQAGALRADVDRGSVQVSQDNAYRGGFSDDTENASR